MVIGEIIVNYASGAWNLCGVGVVYLEKVIHEPQINACFNVAIILFDERLRLRQIFPDTAN